MCYVHGGAIPVVKAKARERELEHRVLRRLGTQAEPVTEPAKELAALIGRVKLVEEHMWQALADARDDNAKSAAIAVYTRAADQLGRFLTEMTKLGIMDRIAAVEEEKAVALAHMVQAVLRDLKLTPEQRAIAPRLIRKHLLEDSGGADVA